MIKILTSSKIEVLETAVNIFIESCSIVTSIQFYPINNETWNEFYVMVIYEP